MSSENHVTLSYGNILALCGLIVIGVQGAAWVEGRVTGSAAHLRNLRDSVAAVQAVVEINARAVVVLDGVRKTVNRIDRKSNDLRRAVDANAAEITRLAARNGMTVFREQQMETDLKSLEATVRRMERDLAVIMARTSKGGGQAQTVITGGP